MRQMCSEVTTRDLNRIVDLLCIVVVTVTLLTGLVPLGVFFEMI